MESKQRKKAETSSIPLRLSEKKKNSSRKGKLSLPRLVSYLPLDLFENHLDMRVCSRKSSGIWFWDLLYFETNWENIWVYFADSMITLG